MTPVPHRRSTHRVLQPELVLPDRRRIDRLRRLANLMDEAFTVPGTNYRIGLDSLIGLIPGIGDLATAAVSAYIVKEARALGLPKRKIARMLANIGLDALIGAVPLAGDAFDAFFKANRKNVAIIDKHFRG